MRFDRDGYLRVNLHSSTHKVHRLVAENFIPNQNKRLEVNHKSGIKEDNRVENLEWVTGEENRKHQVENELGIKRGSDNGNSKLTEREILEIRNLCLNPNLTYTEIGKKFNVSYRTISLIVNNKIWKHI